MYVYVYAIFLSAAVAGVADVSSTTVESVLSYRFVAVRALLATTDERELLEFQIDPGWVAPASEFSDAQSVRNGEDGSRASPEFATSHAGLVWGLDQANYCAQWVENHRTDLKGVEQLTYSASTRVLGRTELFGWHGFCDNALEIRRSTDFEQPGFSTSLRLVDTLFLMTSDPDEGFRRLAVRGRDVEVSIDHLKSKLGGTIVVRSIESGVAESRVFNRLWSIYADDIETVPRRWIYVSGAALTNETYLWDVCVEPGLARSVPIDRYGILKAHHDVDRIEGVGIRDYSGLGPWSHPTVRYFEEGSFGVQSRAGLPVASIIMFVAFAWLFRNWHKSFGERKQHDQLGSTR